MAVCKYKETAIFHFHNANPRSKAAGDCVARAISVALGQTWETTIREMTEVGIKHGLVFNEDKCVALYLKEKGCEQYHEPRDIHNKKFRLESFLKRPAANEGVIVAKVGSHHVTLIVDGIVWDTWDCTREMVHTFWRVPVQKVKNPERVIEKKRFTL